MATLVEDPLLTAQNLITLFALYGFLIELDKYLIFFHVTNISMMLRLVKDVVAYSYNIAF